MSIDLNNGKLFLRKLVSKRKTKPERLIYRGDENHFLVKRTLTTFQENVMTYTVKLSDLLVSGSRREVSRIFFDPVKVARLLGFDVEVDNKGFVARAAIAGKTIKVEKMESILEHISYSYYDMISRKLDFDALPPVDIFQTFGIRVVDDVNDKPRALQANELSLSALLACGEPFRMLLTSLKKEEAARALGFDRTVSETGQIIRAAFREHEITVSEMEDVLFAIDFVFYDHLTGEYRNADRFFKVLQKYGIEIVDDISHKHE